MIEIKNPNKYKVNDKVWWFDAYDTLRNGVIYEIRDTHALIYEDGKKGLKTGAKLSDCWPTKDECLAAENHRSALQRVAYKESIKNVSDLVKFLFKHDVHSEFRDYDAAAAAKERAKELLNLDIAD